MNITEKRELFRLMAGVFNDIGKCKAIKFRMPSFAEHSHGDLMPAMMNLYQDECSTTACFMGHAPLYCKKKPKQGESWLDYMRRLFGTRPIDSLDQTPIKVKIYWFLFHQDWPDSRPQAVARAYKLLVRGEVPAVYGRGKSKYIVPTSNEIESLRKELFDNKKQISTESRAYSTKPAQAENINQLAATE